MVVLEPAAWRVLASRFSGPESAPRRRWAGASSRRTAGGGAVMLMRRHSTKKLSARFPREMPAYRQAGLPVRRARGFAEQRKDKTFGRTGEIPVQASPRMFAGHSMDSTPLTTSAMPLRKQGQMQMRRHGGRRFIADWEQNEICGRTFEILAQASPSMFAGHSMLCPYENTGRYKTEERSFSGDKTSASG